MEKSVMSKSIRYLTRDSVFNDAKPLTVLELRNFLDRLAIGGFGHFKITKPSRSGFGQTGTNSEVTHYTLNDRDDTVLLD